MARDHLRRVTRYRAEPGRVRYCSFDDGGGGGSSTANTSTATRDTRITAGTGSINVSGDSASVTLTDAGAVHDALDFAKSSLASTHADVTAALDASGKAGAQLADAYKTAKQGESTVIIIGAFVVAGVVAVAALRGARG